MGKRERRYALKRRTNRRDLLVSIYFIGILSCVKDVNNFDILIFLIDTVDNFIAFVNQVSVFFL